MELPNVYVASDKTFANLMSTRFHAASGDWKLAQPIRLSGWYLRARFSRAWRVFIGKADVLVWEK